MYPNLRSWWVHAQQNFRSQQACHIIFLRNKLKFGLCESLFVVLRLLYLINDQIILWQALLKLSKLKCASSILVGLYFNKEMEQKYSVSFAVL